MKKRIEIQELLRWTYRDELPKVQPDRGPGGLLPAWRGIDRYAELLASVDERRNGYGLVPDYMATVDAHADALAVAAAVDALDDFTPSVPDGWNPLEDYDGLGDFGVAAVRRALDWLIVAGENVLRTPVSTLVMHRALLGSAPDWQGGALEVRAVRENGAIKWFRTMTLPIDANGFGGYDVEVDGYNKRSGRPYPDAYRRYYLHPDPQEMIIGRAEYELWRWALDSLAETLSGQLDMWEVTPCILPQRPWVEAIPDKRILLDLRRRG